MPHRPAEKNLAPSGQNQHLQSRLASQLRCLAEDATDLELSSLERLARVHDRGLRIRQIEAELAIIPRATTHVISPEGGRR